jgi:nucleoside-diphosphate-sugar epimerase
MEIAHRVGATIFLGLGSQAEYGPREGAIAPDAPTAPTTAYGEAKLAAGQRLATSAEERGMRFVWMRVFSTYGPRDNPHWLIPSLIRDLAAGKRPPMTAAEQLWDLLHVRDAARALRRAIEMPAARGIYNLGSGSAPPLRGTAEFIRDAVDPALPLGIGEIAYRPDQVMHLEADISRLRLDLGWEPDIPLREGLAETVRWYLDNLWIYDEAKAG